MRVDGIRAACPQDDFQIAHLHVPLVFQLGQSLEKRQRIAPLRIQKPAVQHDQRFGTRFRRGFRQARERGFVITVLDYREALGGECVRVAFGTGGHGSGRGEDDPCGVVQHASFPTLLGCDRERVRRRDGSRHGIPEVGNPGKSRDPAEGLRDAMRGHDGVGGPDRPHSMATDQRKPCHTAASHQDRQRSGCARNPG